MTARTITPSDTNSAQTNVIVDGEIAGVIFHEDYAAQPGHRFEGKPYAAWTANRGHLAERYATIEAAADAIAPQNENANRKTGRAKACSQYSFQKLDTSMRYLVTRNSDGAELGEVYKDRPSANTWNYTGQEPNAEVPTTRIDAARRLDKAIGVQA